MNSDNYNDLDWLAFLYLTDELSEVERAAFEERLADDQLAREALASSVELTQTLAAAESIEPPMPVSREVERKTVRWQRVAWFSATMAGCLAVALIYQLVSHLPAPAPVAKNNQANVAKTDAEKIALLWVDQLSLAVQAESDESADRENEADTPLEPVDTLGAIGDAETPDWMFAAVLGMSDNSDMEKLNEELDN